MLHGLRRTVVVVASVAVAMASVSITAPAYADRSGGSTGGSGYDAHAQSVTITLNGDTAPGVASVSAPALCWWEPNDLTTGTMTLITLVETILTFGIGGLDFAAVMKVVKDEKAAGKSFTWYTRKKSATATDAQLQAAGCNDAQGPYQGLFVGRTTRPFAPGTEPEPKPDPVKMAEVAMEHLGIEPALMDHNPKITSINQGTLVNLPTWFWADNADQAVGNASGQRSVTATAGPVSVTVTAKAGDLHLTSPGGSTVCSVQQARTAYAPGTSQDSACILPFTRASNAYADGFPVRASVLWTATWTGTGPGTDGAVHQLDDLPQASTTTVPVRESQAIVNRVG